MEIWSIQFCSADLQKVNRKLSQSMVQYIIESLSELGKIVEDLFTNQDEISFLIEYKSKECSVSIDDSALKITEVEGPGYYSESVQDMYEDDTWEEYFRDAYVVLDIEKGLGI